MSPETPTGAAAQPGQSGAAFCFRVRQERAGWHMLQPVPSRTTIDLAALVCNAPEFLGLDRDEAPCQAAVVLSERGDARVVAAVDEVGAITLVGCPAKLTRDALTTVVQELLVFTGKLWRMPSAEFSAVFEKRLGHSLSDYFSSRVAIGWSENGFRSGLGRTLDRGRFPVVLLLPDTNDEVVGAAGHLKEHNIEVRQIGVELYESAGVEIVMPRLLETAEPRSPEDREPAKPAPRPMPSPTRPPTRPQTPTGGPSVTESSPRAEVVSTQPVSRPEQSTPQVNEPEPAPVSEASEQSVADGSTPAESEPSPKMPWSDLPAPPITDIVPPAPQQKPVTAAPPPAAKAATPRAIWDGTMPGVMSGKRPPRRTPEGQTVPKGREQMGRQER